MRFQNTIPMLLALSLLLSLAPLAPTTGAASTLTVCPSGCTYTSIAAAVQNAAPGDTIDVGVGTYTESLHIAKADLTLRGAKAGIAAGPAKDPENRGDNESVVVGALTLNAPGIVLDGFTFAPQSGTALHLRKGPLSIVNNILVGSGTTGGAYAVRAVNFDGVNLTANNIQNFGAGVLMDGGSASRPGIIDANYIGNLFHGVSAQGSLAGGHVFSNNVFEDITNGALVVVQQMDVLGNSFQKIDRYAILMFVFRAQVNNVSIEDNLFEDNGIGIWNYNGGGTAADNVARGNHFTGNTEAVNNTLTSSFDARGNYWDAPTGTTLSGLGIGETTVGHVNTSEWCLVADCSLTAPTA